MVTVIPSDAKQHDETLLHGIKRDLPALVRLHEHANTHWASEDFVYRYYHQSFKVFGIQTLTLQIVEALRALLPECPFNARFARIIEEGTGKKFSLEMNQRWDEETRPLLEAFFHAHYFLGMAIKYGKELNEAPSMLPSGWAALLYLYDIR